MHVKRLLLIGPKPPPWDGTSVKFHIFTEFAEKELGQDVVDVLNCYIGDKTIMPLFSIDSLTGYIRILAQVIFKGYSADIIVLFGSQRFASVFGSLASAACHIIGKRIYISLFGGGYDVFLNNLRAAHYRFVRALFGYSEGIIVETRHLQLTMNSVWPGKIHYVPNFRQSVSTSSEYASQGSSTVRFLYVGQVRPEKGIGELLAAFSLLEETIALYGTQTSVSLDLYGPVLETSSKWINLVHLQQCPNIHLHGEVSHVEVLRAYGEADVFVFPSHNPTEGHPGALIEALMQGLPVIATSWRTIPELIRDNRNGLLCPPHDPVALAACMERLVRDAGLRKRLAEGAKESAGEFDAERACAAMLKIIMD